MTLQEIKLLHAFNSWATNRLFDALAPLPPDELTKDMKSSHASIHATLTHLVGAEKIWLSRLAGMPEKEMITAAEVPTLSAVKAVWEKTGFGMAQFLGTMTDKKLKGSFSVAYPTGKTYTYVYSQAIQHLVNHSTYHRGQIVAMMRQLGHAPPKTDLIAFYRETSGQS
ncbi:MAG: DinB family protein [Bacteroidota bacterium]